MHLAHSEAMLFKFGSGTGTDLSPIRSQPRETFRRRPPSGPMSFLKVYDQAPALYLDSVSYVVQKPEVMQ